VLFSGQLSAISDQPNLFGRKEAQEAQTILRLLRIFAANCLG